MQRKARRYAQVAFVESVAVAVQQVFTAIQQQAILRSGMHAENVIDLVLQQQGNAQVAQGYLPAAVAVAGIDIVFQEIFAFVVEQGEQQLRLQPPFFTEAVFCKYACIYTRAKTAAHSLAVNVCKKQVRLQAIMKGLPVADSA